jgi:glycerophosphoryl diester phosphodiesterase
MPENTLPAFERALEIGVTTLELDIGMTRDGVLVIHHDFRLNPEITRDAEGRWIKAPGPLLWTLSAEELGRYDVGRIDPASAYAKRFPLQQPRDGTHIPRLEELFARVRMHDNKAVRFNIETKVDPERPSDTAPPEQMTRALIGAIRSGGLVQRSTVQSFDWRTLRLVQAEAPEIATVYLTSEQLGANTVAAAGKRASAWTAGLALKDYSSVPHMVHAAGGRIWSPDFSDLSSTNIAFADALGVRIVAWTVNTPKDLARVLALGVDGVISDYPDRAAEAIRRRGLDVRGVNARP